MKDTLARARPRRLHNFALTGGLAALALATTSALAWDGPGGTGVQIVAPDAISPLLSIPPWVANGPAEHRRVITHDSVGAVAMDIGYNTYRKGVRLATPYAYKTDEFCYIAKGRIAMEGETSTIEVSGGTMMWRPAGGVTKSATFLEDTITICAMAPARLDANSHRIQSQDVGKWAGAPGDRPYPHWFKLSEAPLITALDTSASKGIVERELVSKRKDGSAKASVVHIGLKRGAHLALGPAGEQICWVEDGTLSLSWAGNAKTATAHDFIYRSSGTRLDHVEATSPASLLCLSGPATL